MQLKKKTALAAIIVFLSGGMALAQEPIVKIGHVAQLAAVSLTSAKIVKTAHVSPSRS